MNFLDKQSFGASRFRRGYFLEAVEPNQQAEYEPINIFFDELVYGGVNTPKQEEPANAWP